MDLTAIGGRIALFFVPFLFALCFHEYAHGLVAKWRGDNTAERLGRLTLNPFAHADLVGTFLLPLGAIIFGIPIFFGWAKPVPVETRNLKNVRSDMFWIALAGPLSNILLAIVGTGILFFVVRSNLSAQHQATLSTFMQMFILINLFLAIFNIIPLHPLDGGKVLARFLPYSWNQKMEQNEHMTGIILMVLLISGILGVLRVPVFGIFNYLMGIVGIGSSIL